MEVILKEDVEHLGQKGDVVDVKDGYGRNYLIPQRKAVIATEGNVKAIEEERRQQRMKIKKRREDAEALAERLKELDLQIPMQVGEENRIFGTVTTRQLADRLEGEGIEVDSKDITIHGDVRVLGSYTASIDVHSDVDARMTFEVVPEEDEDS
jgi:large subunit ribosomal protein L9